jgi:hypothetical protein
MSVREALLSTVEAFHVGLDDENKQCSDVKAATDGSGSVVGGQPQTMVKALLANQVESNEPMARFVAVRYAASAFPSRYLLLLATGDK